METSPKFCTVEGSFPTKYSNFTEVSLEQDRAFKKRETNEMLVKKKVQAQTETQVEKNPKP